MPDYQGSPLFTETEKLALQYTDAMTTTPVDVPDELFGKLKEGFNEVQLVELTSAIAWENYRARFDHAFGIESEGFTEGSYCALPIRPGKEKERATAKFEQRSTAE